MMAGSGKQTKMDDEIGNLEERLKFHFNPVKPDPKFVDHLQRRLTVEPDVIVEQPPRILLLLVIAGMGLFSGALAIWLLHKIRES